MYEHGEVIETTTTHRVRLVPDEDRMNPRRDFDHLGILLAEHRRYGHDLGDVEADDVAAFVAEMREVSDQPLIESLVKHLVRQHGATAVLPVYLYDHSGLSVSSGPNLVGADDLNIPTRTGWDSGLLGFIYDTAEQREEWQITEPDPEQVAATLAGEVTELNQYLTGQVYGYVVEERNGSEDDWVEVGSCWGLYGDEHAREAALDALHGYSPTDDGLVEVHVQRRRLVVAEETWVVRVSAEDADRMRVEMDINDDQRACDQGTLVRTRCFDTVENDQLSYRVVDPA